MSIDWFAFVQVFLASLIAAAGVVALYALGIRFLATPGPKVARADGTFEPDGPARDDENDDIDDTNRPRYATILANVCFVLSAAMVLVGIYLIVPALH